MAATETDRRAVLVVGMDVDPAMEDEFNRWFDTEHIPERLAVPGVLSARRFRSDTDSPRYLAIYELNDVSVVQSDYYLRLLGDARTDWTKRMIPYLRNRTRGLYVQIFPTA